MKIPIYDIVSLTSGFYKGYCDAKGIPLSDETNFITIYGPTIFSTVSSPIMNKGSCLLRKFMANQLYSKTINGELSILSNIKKTIKYKDLDLDSKKEILPKIVSSASNLEDKIKNQKYFLPTICASTKAIIGTTVGYGTGRLVGYLN